MLCFSVEFLDGNSKNPQHLALQATYVSSGSLPSPTNQSCRTSINSLGRKHSSRDSDNVYLNGPRTADCVDGAYADSNAESRLPLCSVGHGSRVRSKPKPTAIHADQIRKLTYESDSLRTKSYDRLIRRENDGRQGEIVPKNSRPKSLYSDAFIE